MQAGARKRLGKVVDGLDTHGLDLDTLGLTLGRAWMLNELGCGLNLDARAGRRLGHVGPDAHVGLYATGLAARDPLGHAMSDARLDSWMDLGSRLEAVGRVALHLAPFFFFFFFYR